MKDLALTLVFLVGIALVAVGLYEAWQPVAWIWVGGCLLFSGWRLVKTR